MKNFYKNSFDYDKRLLNPLIDEILRIFTIGYLVLLGFSQVRALEYGILKSDITLYITVFLILLMYLFKDKISTLAKYTYLILSTLLAGIVSVSNLGILTGAVFLFSVLILLLALFYSKRVVQFFTLGTMAFFVYMTYLFTIEEVNFIQEPLVLLQSTRHWLVYLAFIFLFFIICGTVIIKYRTTMDELILELNRQKESVEKLANYDYLTGLANYNLLEIHFEKIIAKAKRNNKIVGLAFADLDGFKLINDNYGHDVGDYCLKVIALRLESQIRQSDFVCRAGGDEFIIIFDELNEKDDIKKIVKKIIKDINRPIKYEDIEFSVGISFGVSFYPDNAHKLNDLRKYADQAMYKVKRANKNSFKIFED